MAVLCVGNMIYLAYEDKLDSGTLIVKRYTFASVVFEDRTNLAYLRWMVRQVLTIESRLKLRLCDFADMIRGRVKRSALEDMQRICHKLRFAKVD